MNRFRPAFLWVLPRIIKGVLYIFPRKLRTVIYQIYAAPHYQKTNLQFPPTNEFPPEELPQFCALHFDF